jgi:hypothetical protein
MQRRLFVLAVAITVAVLPGPGRASTTPEQVKSDLEMAAIRYFLENAHPDTGLVRDGAENFQPTPPTNNVASMASTGYALAVLSNAALRGLIDKEMVKAFAVRVLTFSRDHVPRYHGWFLHFVNWETGQREWYSEYSTIDTALFMAGALYAAQVFPDSEVSEITETLYRDLDFLDFMSNGGTKPAKRTLSMAWMPEYGYTAAQWDMYAEHMLLLILGLGHKTHPLPAEVWKAWARPVTTLPSGEKIMGFNAPLFIHQYSQLYIDFRGFSDGFANYHENARIATHLHHSMGQTDTHYKTFAAGFWGLSAGQSPRGYDVWDPTHYVGTVCIDCVVGSVVFSPDLVLNDMSSWADGPFRNRIWGRYGFIDSLDLDREWYAHQVLGITIGPAYMSLANMHSETSFWKLFMQIPEIRNGMAKVGVIKASDETYIF